MKDNDMTHQIENLVKKLASKNNMFGIITRVELADCSGGLFNRKAMANWDYNGKGFKHKLSRESDGQAAYYIEDVIEFIRENYRVVTKKK